MNQRMFNSIGVIGAGQIIYGAGLFIQHFGFVRIIGAKAMALEVTV
jgi:hypothetical protein